MNGYQVVLNAIRFYQHRKMEVFIQKWKSINYVWWYKDVININAFILNKCQYSIQDTYTSNQLITSVEEILLYKTIMIVTIDNLCIIINPSTLKSLLSVNNILCVKNNKLCSILICYYDLELK